MYRLYAIQSFNGEKVAVYVYDPHIPEAEILVDAQEIVDGKKTYKEVIKEKNELYGSKPHRLENTNLIRKQLIYCTRCIKRGQEIIEENDNLDKAVFLNGTVKKEWRGQTELYHNVLFDVFKTDTPEFTGCTEIGKITI